jgi:hypothetical protein
MYYKARYYDAKIGRFLQQDSMAFPNQVQGMNRMMYVEGNPVGFRDPSGNSTDYGNMFSQIVKHMMGGFKWASGGLAGAANAVDKAMNKPTNYDRTPFAKSMKGIFGKSLGGTINQYWNNVFNKTWTKWTANDFAIGFKAWGGSFLAISGAFALGGMMNSAAINTMRAAPSMLMQSSHFVEFMAPSSIGYTAGGLGTSSFNNIQWNESSARAGAFLGFSLQLAAGAGFFGVKLAGTKAFETFMAKEMFTIMGKPVIVSQGISVLGVGLSLATNDINGMGYSSLGLIFPEHPILLTPVPFIVSLGKGIIRTYNGML